MPSDRATSGEKVGPSRHYEIGVRGLIGPTVLQAFPTLTARRRGRDTVLSGPLPDQSALYGVIHQLETLALELVEVRSLPSAAGRGDPHAAKPAEAAASRTNGDLA